MNYKETIDYLASIENNNWLGIYNRIDLNQRKMPIIFPKMHRTHFARLLHELDFRKGAEVGVYKGVYSKIIAKNNRQMQLYCIDPWKASDDYAEEYTQEQMEEIYQEARKRLALSGSIIIRKPSLEAAEEFEDGSLDFVYIDANHEFVHVAQDIYTWGKKVRSGGIVSGHDWARYKNHAPCHVKDVVNAWAYSHKIRPWFVMRGKKNTSWFWVKK